VIYALGEAGDRIGIALSNACNLLNPDVIFLGGPLRGHAPYKEAIEAAISRYALKHSRPDVRWSPEMALTPELAGAAARAVQQFFDDHLQSTIEKTLPEDAVSP
jgi:predicted NBD/HSP70 family sugar kinase